MHRSFISTVIAAALAITSVSASMAQAEQYRPAARAQNYGGGNEAVAGVLAGAAALFIIGKAIENNGGFKKKSHSSKRHVYKAPRSRHSSRSNHRAHRHYSHRSQRGRHGHRNANRHYRH